MCNAVFAAREVQQVLNAIWQQKALGRTVVIVTHRRHDLLAIADRMIVMKQGRITADDPVGKASLSRPLR